MMQPKMFLLCHLVGANQYCRKFGSQSEGNNNFFFFSFASLQHESITVVL